MYREYANARALVMSTKENYRSVIILLLSRNKSIKIEFQIKFYTNTVIFSKKQP